MIKADNALLLEEPLLRVPYEMLRKNLKTVHKHMTQESTMVEQTLSKLQQSTQHVAAEYGEKQQEEARESLDHLISRVRGLKRKIATLKEEQNETLTTTKARVEHLNVIFDNEKETDPEKQKETEKKWLRTRLERLLTDYFLRQGFSETAKSFAQNRGITSLVDVTILDQCISVETSLRQRHSTAECLAWCSENRSFLRKTRSSLEFEVRLQHYVELVKSGRVEDALKYCQRFLSKNADIHLREIQQAAGLLAFPPGTEGSPYKDLYACERWNQLSRKFVQTFADVHGLSDGSSLLYTLSTGLSVLKTHSCRNFGAPAELPITADKDEDMDPSLTSSARPYARRSENLPSVFGSGFSIRMYGSDEIRGLDTLPVIPPRALANLSSMRRDIAMQNNLDLEESIEDDNEESEERTSGDGERDSDGAVPVEELEELPDAPPELLSAEYLARRIEEATKENTDIIPKTTLDMFNHFYPGCCTSHQLSRADACPVCSVELNSLAENLPYAHHIRSHLDADPVVLPNSRIFGRAKLMEYSHKMMKAAPNTVVDPTSFECFKIDELITAYPS
ncbi:YALIA101S03e13828g1_1 [Yarrowia lipolytica]|nr:Protein FYV10 [Yarrowia lipolytica]SEI33250.1 YALIA101S03e13828g1_1 [Yarrowia lipolytica]